MKWTAFDEVHECGVIEYDVHADQRGWFMETFNRREVACEGIPIPWQWAQDSLSFSLQGVQRGFHLQRRNPQGKLVSCLIGKILDVCLDLRRDSPTFMKITRVILSSDKAMSFYLPPGTAHAFLALEHALVQYKCTSSYDAETDGGVDAMSPELAFVWPEGNFFRSEKDRALPKLVDYLNSIA